MDLNKLKLGMFKNIQVLNFPESYDLGVKSTEKNVEVIIYYIHILKDIQDLVALVDSTVLPEDNRVILVYEKGRKDGVNRDSVMGPFTKGQVDGYMLRAPMLCSISRKLSACVFSKKLH